MTSAVQDLKDGYGGSTVTKGLVFSDYDSDGYPHKAEFVGSWSVIAVRYCYGIFDSNTFARKITSLTIPDGVTEIKQEAFRADNSLVTLVISKDLTTFGAGAFNSCVNVTSVTMRGNVPNMPVNTFASMNKVELYDFSHATSIPTLYSPSVLGHKANCVIKIPSALSDTTLGTGNGWESKTNWASLTDVTWQGV